MLTGPNPMLPAQVRNRDTALSLADHTHDLGVSKAITLHQNLLNSYAEKILIQKSLFLWGDYHVKQRQARYQNEEQTVEIHLELSWQDRNAVVTPLFLQSLNDHRDILWLDWQSLEMEE